MSYKATKPGSVLFLSLVVSMSASDQLERLVSEMTYNVLMGTLNHTHSLTPHVANVMGS